MDFSLRNVTFSQTTHLYHNNGMSRTERLNISLRSTSEAADIAVTSQKQSQGSVLFSVTEAPQGIQGSNENPKSIRMQFNNLAESNTETKIQFL
jgi:hypothetical protein